MQILMTWNGWMGMTKCEFIFLCPDKKLEDCSIKSIITISYLTFCFIKPLNWRNL